MTREDNISFAWFTIIRLLVTKKYI